MRKLSLLLLIILGASCLAAAQTLEPTKGTLTGRVVCAKTGEPLPGVNIILLGTVLGTTTDLQGRFYLSGIPPGIYSVKVSMMGYKSKTVHKVRIIPGEVTSLDFKLEETVIQAPAVVVTATKRRQSFQDSPNSVTVITSREIEQKNTFTLDNVLRYTPGVNIAAGQVNIRGSTGYSRGAGSRVLLLIDGCPAITGDAGTINWDALPITEIKRVEVVKGAGSALYGSNALGGVINVITKEPSEVPETRMRLTYGVYDKPIYPEWGRWIGDRWLTYEGIDISHSRKIENLGLLLSVGRKRSSGYRQNGHFLRWNALTKLSYRFSPQSRLTLYCSGASEDHGEVIMWRVKNGQPFPMEVPRESIGDEVLSQKLNAHLTFDRILSRKLAYTIKPYYYHTYWKNDFHDNRDYSKTHKLGCEVRVLYLPTQGHSLTAGVEGVYHRVKSKIFGHHRTYDLAWYAQDEIRVSSPLAFTLGVRYDYHRVDDLFSEEQLSPKVGLVHRPSSSTSLRASVGRGFRAASVAEIFTNTLVSGFRVVPNLNIRAESAWSYEVGWNQVLGSYLWMDMALFNNDYWNMIDPEVVSADTLRLANLIRARIRGFEIELRGNWWDRRLVGNLGYTYIDAKDLTSDQVLEYRPRHLLTSSLTLNYRLSLNYNNYHLGADLQFGVDFRYVSRLERVKVFKMDERVPQYVVDLRAVSAFKTFALAVKVDNLLQYYYTEVERNLAPPRSYTLTLTARL